MPRPPGMRSCLSRRDAKTQRPDPGKPLVALHRCPAADIVQAASIVRHGGGSHAESYTRHC